jgi:hypothetical protein
MRSGFKAGAKVSRMRTPTAEEMLEKYEDDAVDVATQHFNNMVRQNDVKTAGEWLSVLQDIQQASNPRPRKLHS